jgi:DNA-binding protein HU-beta
LNKNDLVAAVADSSGLSKTDAAKAVDGVFDAISNSLKSGSAVRLVGFGTFSVSRRAATTGRNPRTGEQIQIAASQKVKFLPAKALKEMFNK